MEVVRWGIMSTAQIGLRKVVPAIQRAERCEVIAVASRDLAAAQEYASQLGIPQVHGSYEALLANPAIDAVYIPLPNHMHMEWAIAAARAGKHVLCEKPLALDAAQAQKIVDACQDAGVVLMEAFMYRLHPSWVAVREMVASGRIGKLVSVQSWFGYYNDDAANIRNIAEYGGGALYDVGSYCINLSRMLFGSEPRDVKAALERDPQMGVDTLTSAILEFENGSATFTCSTRAANDQRVHIYGSNGRISLDIAFNIPPDKAVNVNVTPGGTSPTSPNTETLSFGPVDQYTIQAEAFAAAVLDATPLPFPPADAVANMRVIDRIFEATR